jgi:hypothetical protein
MKITKGLVGGVAALALLGGWAGVASAGEVTGSGKPKTVQANSICAYSGLEDNDGEFVEPGVTQNWGQIPKEVRAFLASIGLSPGTACNGHLSPYPPGPVEP